MPTSAGADAEIAKLGWTVGKTLGEGSFGLVKFVTKGQQSAACKIIAKPSDQAEMDAIELEWKIMSEAKHPCIVKCFEAAQTPGDVFLFLELMGGGELFDCIVERGKFTEHDAAEVSYKLLGALQYLHNIGFVHRDLKPENVLLSKKGDLSAVKLTDFGLSAKMDHQSEKLSDPVGTPGYVAPEILMGRKYDALVDVWSMGVIIYILLCGFPPFFDNNERLMYEKIKKGAYKFVSPHWDKISQDAKRFITRMLIVDPNQRRDITTCLADTWLKTSSDLDLVEAAPDHNYTKKLKETENKLAAQRHFEMATSVAAAQVKLARFTRRLRRKSKAKRAAKRAASAYVILLYALRAVGTVMDLSVYGVLPLLGVEMQGLVPIYSNATVMLPKGRGYSTSAYRVPSATLLSSCLHITFGCIRFLAASRPSEVGVWLAAMMTMVVEIAAGSCMLAMADSTVLGPEPMATTVSGSIAAVLLLAMMMAFPQPPKFEPPPPSAKPAKSAMKKVKLA